MKIGEKIKPKYFLTQKIEEIRKIASIGDGTTYTIPIDDHIFIESNKIFNSNIEFTILDIVDLIHGTTKNFDFTRCYQINLNEYKENKIVFQNEFWIKKYDIFQYTQEFKNRYKSNLKYVL